MSLLTAVLKKHRGDINFKNIDLPVLLAMWLSFSMRKVRGLTKSKSISGDYLTIKEVIVDVRKEAITKEMGKNPAGNRRHRIPPYIKDLIDYYEKGIHADIFRRMGTG